MKAPLPGKDFKKFKAKTKRSETTFFADELWDLSGVDDMGKSKHAPGNICQDAVVVNLDESLIGKNTVAYSNEAKSSQDLGASHCKHKRIRKFMTIDPRKGRF